MSNIGTFTHLLGAGWSMTTMSRSPTLSSLVQAAWAIPGFLLALHAGAIADRFDRRRVIVATQLAALTIAAALVDAVSFIGVVAVARAYCPPGRATAQRDLGPGPIRAGLRHVSASAGLRRAALQLAVLSAVGAALAAVLPLVARDRLDVSPAGFGWLAGGLGVGSVVAVWGLPRTGAASYPGRAVVVSAAIWSTGTALFAISTEVWMGVLALFLSGAGQMGALSTLFSNYTVQLPNWVRGRASALAMLMVWLGVSAGAVAWGAIASSVGLRSVLLLAAACNVVVALLASRVVPVTAARVAGEPESATETIGGRCDGCPLTGWRWG